MDSVSDDFFLALAEISSALTGLFLVGIVLYIQVGYDKAERSRAVVEPYLRAATSITFIAYALPLVVSLTLVSLPIGWSAGCTTAWSWPWWWSTCPRCPR